MISLLASICWFTAVAGLMWPARAGKPTAIQPHRAPAQVSWLSADRRWMIVTGIGIAVIPLDAVSGVAIVLCGPTGWWWQGRRNSEEIKRLRRQALPETLDLLAIAIASGTTVAGAMQLVRTEGPSPVRDAFNRVLLRASSGQPLATALTGLSDDLGESYHPLAAVLISSVRDGAPLVQILERLGDQSRLSRRRRAEERARRLPVLMMFPLALCSMPAVLVGTVVPLVVVGFRSTSF